MLSYRTEDIAGKKFNRLTVIDFDCYEQNGNSIFKRGKWNCICDCGNSISILSQSLKSGKTKSCGCLHKENQSKKCLPNGDAGFNKLFKEYKLSAKNRGYVFDLSKDEARIIFETECFYCGIQPFKISRTTHRSKSIFLYNGIDRIDNTKGYIRENCRSCCIICNQAKHTMNEEDFYLWIFRVADNLKGGK